MSEHYPGCYRMQDCPARAYLVILRIRPPHVCGTAVPESDKQWRACLEQLLQGALELLSAVKECLRQIERDVSLNDVLAEWKFRTERYKAPHEFDDLVEIVATDMGLVGLEPSEVRKRFHERWNSSLRLLSVDCDVQAEARKLVEQTLLNDLRAVLPMTGEDVMECFGIAPGRNVGILLRKAAELYSVAPCTKKELLEKLKPLHAQNLGAELKSSQDQLY